MGCGASKAANEADPLAPTAARNKSSSVVSVNQKQTSPNNKPTLPAAHTRDESNPFLDKQPGIDEHKGAASARKKVERSEEKEENEVEELTTPKNNSKKGQAEEEKEKESDDEGEGDENATAAEEKEGYREKNSGRQLIPASTPVTPAARTTPTINTITQPRKDGTAAPNTTLARSTTFTDHVLQQPPSYNLADPLTLTSGMSKCFLHYAHKKFDTSHSHSPTDAATDGGDDDDEDKLDKKAVTQLTYDCVITFMLQLKKEMVKVKEINRKKEEDYQRRRYVPGDTVDEVLDTCKEYIKSELVWKNGGITKTCFFFHFPRAYRAMFVYEKMTLEREQLVVKWNKVCVDNRAKAEKDREKERKKDEAHMAGLDSPADGGGGGEKDKDKEGKEKHQHKKKKDKKDKEGRKTDRKKARQTAPANSDLFANMAAHGSSKPPQLAQAEAKLKSAQQANGKGSTRNLMKGVEKDDDD